MKYNQLTPEEKRIIVDKGTEMPGSGEYDNFFVSGIYTCRQCNAWLYRSADKFSAHCGWPSFDQEIAGAVKRQIDNDGQRTEILCARCEGHLGHVFVGEKLTSRDTRHCVNSLSLRFIPTDKLESPTHTIVLGGGCFWCLEAYFSQVQGILGVESGYAGGNIANPTYEQVCTGKTNHAEVVKIEFDQTQIAMEMILQIFFTLHDPTTRNRQGADVGSQYRSIILVNSDEQKEIVENFITKLRAEKVFSEPIVTEVKLLDKFYKAEEHHQQYFAKNPQAAYCQAVISPKMAKLRQHFSTLLKP